MGPPEALRAFPPEGRRTRWTGEARSTGALVGGVPVFSVGGGSEGRAFAAFCKDECRAGRGSAMPPSARTV